jgi:Uncharacterized conserved protein (COG2071)
MTNVAPRGVPSMPWLSEFPELNVRMYLRVPDRPGVYFSVKAEPGSLEYFLTERYGLYNVDHRCASYRLRPLASELPHDSCADQLPQRDGIAHGIPFAVVVEIDEDVAIHALPLSDAICPPAKVGVRV